MWKVIAYLNDGEEVEVEQDEQVARLNPKISGYLDNGIVIQSEDGNVRTYYPGRVIKKIVVKKFE